MRWKTTEFFLFHKFISKFIKSLMIEKYLSFIGGKKIILQLGGIPQVEASFTEKLKFRILNFNLLSIIKILRLPKNIFSNFIIKF